MPTPSVDPTLTAEADLLIKAIAAARAVGLPAPSDISPERQEERHLRAVEEASKAYRHFKGIFPTIELANERLSLLGQEWIVTHGWPGWFTLQDPHTRMIVSDLPSLGNWFLVTHP